VIKSVVDQQSGQTIIENRLSRISQSLRRAPELLPPRFCSFLHFHRFSYPLLRIRLSTCHYRPFYGSYYLALGHLDPFINRLLRLQSDRPLCRSRVRLLPRQSRPRRGTGIRFAAPVRHPGVPSVDMTAAGWRVTLTEWISPNDTFAVPLAISSHRCSLNWLQRRVTASRFDSFDAAGSRPPLSEESGDLIKHLECSR
jgi:hypothetical protein